jgi:hypothetical protein
MRKLFQFLPVVLVVFFCNFNAHGQEHGVSASAPQLEFSQPKLIENVGADSRFAARFNCDSDGTIHANVLSRNGDSDPMLLAIHADGTSTSFSAQLPGFTEISTPQSVFVGNGKVYALVSAKSISPNPGDASRRWLVLIFDKQGALTNTVQLKQGMRPLLVGAFASGHILLGSEDPLNHRMALTLVDEHGTHVGEIALRDNDFVARAASLPQDGSGTGSYSAMFLIAMSQFIPSGDHLLLVPEGTSGLPVVELKEEGVVNSLVPKLPDGEILEAFLGFDATTFTAQLGTRTVPKSPINDKDASGKHQTMGVIPMASVVKISRTDGSIVKEIALGGNQVQPACEVDGVLHSLIVHSLTGTEEGLQVTTAVLH